MKAVNAVCWLFAVVLICSAIIGITVSGNDAITTCEMPEPSGEPMHTRPEVIPEATAEPLPEIITEPVTLVLMYDYLGEFRLTAYCSCEKCCGVWALNRPLDEYGNEIVYGAAGERLTQGESIAVDPSVIPYGSTVIIAGQRYRAQDCGGAIKGNRIDVYFNDHAEALKFGVQREDVFMEVARNG